MDEKKILSLWEDGLDDREIEEEILDALEQEYNQGSVTFILGNKKTGELDVRVEPSSNFDMAPDSDWTVIWNSDRTGINMLEEAYRLVEEEFRGEKILDLIDEVESMGDNFDSDAVWELERNSRNEVERQKLINDIKYTKFWEEHIKDIAKEELPNVKDIIIENMEDEIRYI